MRDEKRWVYQRGEPIAISTDTNRTEGPQGTGTGPTNANGGNQLRAAKALDSVAWGLATAAIDLIGLLSLEALQ